MIRRFATGVVIGKFYPPHNGHHYLIRTASAQCDLVYVLLCWKPDQNVPLSVRAACLREVHPEVEVIEVNDALADDDTAGWAAHTLRILGKVPDAVFTSEDYGESYARAMGSTHVMVDRERAKVPCSGTAVRADPLAYLDCLSPCMRAFYVKRVCILGAESTGTTTLAEALAERYKTLWVPEYGREYCIEKWRDGYTDEWTTEEFIHIVRQQIRKEDEAARTANRILICDTDPFASSIWHLRYMGARSPELDGIAAERHYDLYILTGDEIPFEQDGYRDGESIRHWMHEVFVRELSASGRRWGLVSGSHLDRMVQAFDLIAEICPSR